MKNSVNQPTADEIADMADSGRDISHFFTNQGTMKQPVTRINVDFMPDMLQEFDQLAAELRVSRQAAIKSYSRQGQRMTQVIGKLKYRQSVIKSCLWQTLDQPWIKIS